MFLTSIFVCTYSSLPCASKDTLLLFSKLFKIYSPSKTKYMLFHATDAAALPSPLRHTDINSGLRKSIQPSEWMAGAVGGWQKYAGRWARRWAGRQVAR